MKALLSTIAAALAVPAAAFAGGPSMVARDVPLHTSRALAAAPPTRFNMVGVHWQGTGSVEFRTQGAHGTWSPWQRADDDLNPDGRSSENRVHGWRLGGLAWTGTAAAIRFRTSGRVSRIRAYYVWSPPEATSLRRLAIANAPPIIPRLSWGADESIRRAPPQFASAIQYAVVHHTAGSNDYTAAQSGAIVRGIELYHVQGNGWNDIGYNFLVDKYGQVFEGRYGGVDKAVIGAHAEGFNTGSVGVAVIGDYGSSGISAAAKASLEKLLAWRLDLAHVDPVSTLSVLSGGNPRFPKNVPVLLRAVSGHRDTNFTDCPGTALYAELPQIARDVAALGGPKVYAPAAVGKLGGPIRFSARLSASLPWTVVVTDPSGAVAEQSSGTGAIVDWTWDATLATPQKYTWTIATADARSASGTIGSGTAAALAIQSALATPSLLAPGGDPSDDTATITYTLTAAATVTATFVDPAGQTLSTLFSEPKPAGAQTFTFTPPGGLAPGIYTIQLAAAGGNAKTATATVYLTFNDALSGFAVSPAVFSSATGGSAVVTFTLTRPLTVQLEVLQGATIVATQPAVALQAGSQTMTWNGRLDDGTVAADGTYTLSLQVDDPALSFTLTAPVTVDSTPPVITVLSYPTLRFRLSEPVTLTLVVGTSRYSRELKTAATTTFWLKQKPRAYLLIATDPAGNTSSVRYRAK
jgi:hypothetical protein